MFYCFSINMAEELMNRIINAVDNLRQETQRRNGNGSALQESRASTQSSQSIEGEMRRLYPSINSVHENASLAGNNSAPDRNYVQSIRNFQPSTNYRPKKGKKSVVQKRKRLAGTNDEENPSKNKPVLRDVVLLPSPKIDYVPRGSKREQLYTEGYVISAFEIRDSHTENEIRKRVTNAFGEKLRNIPEPKFKFVRAVGNKIVDHLVKHTLERF